MTADLVARLRGIIAAKPPHVTVLADNVEVYPIRGELLREAADRLAAAEELIEDMSLGYHADHALADGHIIFRTECQVDLCKRAFAIIAGSPEAYSEKPRG